MQISRTRSTYSQDVLHLRSKLPEHIIKRFINHFWERRPWLLQRVLFTNDDGVGEDGVTRGAFSLFWDMVVGTPFILHG